LAGARVSGGDEKSFGEEEVRDLGFLFGGGSPIYKPRRAAAFILDVGVTAVDPAPASAPRSCFRPEAEDDEGVCWAGYGVGCWAGLDYGQMGCGQVSGLPPFFLLLLFSLFSVSYFGYAN
jgi:hypothetical protein